MSDGIQILDGRAAAAAVRAELGIRVAELASRGIAPGLGTVLVGDDPGSHSYVSAKHRDCRELRIATYPIVLAATASQQQVLDAVRSLNENPGVTGLIVQLPLPGALDAHAILEAIDPAKDADGLHPINLGRLVLGQPAPLPCTPQAIIELLRMYNITIEGAHVVVIGRGLTVGRPLGLMLTRRSENATVTLAHTGTRNLDDLVKSADIVVAATGVARLVKASMIKPGATVIDVGITRTDLGLVGDVDPEVAEVAGALAPMPGGVGPMTRAMLLRNVVEAAER